MNTGMWNNLHAPSIDSKGDVDVHALSEKIDHLALICRALWTFAEEKGVTEQEFIARVVELDLKDGKLDNKLASGAKTCQECGKKINSRHRLCMYCGCKLAPSNPFDRL